MFERQTARLLLRDFVEDDWRVVYALSQAPSVTRYQLWLRLASEAEARQWVLQAIHHNQIEPRRAYNLALVQTSTQRVIGWLGWGVPRNPAHGDYDFGYALLPEAWGEGYMSEALQAALGFMFAKLGARLVTGECDINNPGSGRVMEKAGMTATEEWQEADQADGSTSTHRRYAIRAQEWQSSVVLGG